MVISAVIGGLIGSFLYSYWRARRATKTIGTVRINDAQLANDEFIAAVTEAVSEALRRAQKRNGGQLL